MGQMEETSRKRTRNSNIKFLLLATAAMSAGIALALVAPNVLGAMQKLGMVPKKRGSEYINGARKRLKREGLLVEKDGFLKISERGEKTLAHLTLSLARPRTEKKWDGKWRVLIFDIPERRRLIRIQVRTMLSTAGFVRVQDSVWMYPYPCEEYVALLKADARIGKDLLYLIVESIEGDSHFRSLFGLPTSPITATPPQKLPALIETLIAPILPAPKQIR